MMSDDYLKFTEENVRLIILKGMADEDNATLNDARIGVLLETFGYSKTQEYIRNQLAYLEQEVGALKLFAAGTAVMATLTKAGRNHVERRRFLPGVQRPGDIE